MIRFDWWSSPRGFPENFGRTIYLLGTAGRGPIGQPTPVKTPEEAKALFGELGSLSRAVGDVLVTNPRAAVVCYRIGGEYATCIIPIPVDPAESGGNATARGLYLRSTNGCDADNDLAAEVMRFPPTGTEPAPAALTILGPDAGVLRTYWFSDHETLGDLTRAINQDADLGLVPCYAATDFPLAESSLLQYYGQLRTPFTGGLSGADLTKDELFLALEKAYELLEGLHIDVVVPLGAFLDDAWLVDYYGTGQYSEAQYASPADRLTLWDTEMDRPATFHAQLVDFCRRQHDAGWMTHGVMGTRPLTDPVLLENPDLYIPRLITETALRTRLGLLEGTPENPIDRGFSISLVAGDLQYQAGTPREHWETGALAYAAMICGLDGELTTTNRPVPGNPRQRVEFQSHTLTDLAHLGVVAFRTSVKQGLVVSNGVTAALPDTDLHLLSNVRMLQVTLANLNALTRELRGQNIDDLMRSGEAERQITELLNQLKLAGILREYRFAHKFNRSRRMLTIAVQFRTRNSLEELSVSGELMLLG